LIVIAAIAKHLSKNYIESPIAILVAVAGAFLIYSTVISSFFLSDDFGFIYQSKQCPIALVECLRRFGGALFFRPITSFSFYFDFLLGQLAPSVYHGTNILLHGINSYLVWVLARLLIPNLEFKEWRDRLPIVAGILFLVLPSHSEAVTWISARSDLLVTCFILLSLTIYITKGHKILSFILCPIFFALALGSKESAIAYPILLFVYEIYCWTREKKIFAKFILTNGLIYTGVILSYLAIRYHSIGVFVGGYGEGFNTSFFQVFGNLLAFTMRTFFPPLGMIWLTVLSIFCLGILIWRWRSQFIPSSIYAVLALLFSGFLLFLAPVLNLAISLDNTQEERFLYLPSVFAVIILSICLAVILPKDGKRFSMGILSISLCLTIALLNSNQVWISASQIAENAIASLKSLDSAEKLYVVNLPDRYRGAYIFRNSFPRAVQLFVPGKFAEVQTISFHNLEDVNHGFSAIDSQLKSESAPVQFYFKSKGETFKPQLGNLETKNFKILNLSDRGFSFSLPNFKSGDKLVYYSDQKLIEIP
jgi:protein O-mannosyl-transferase